MESKTEHLECNYRWNQKRRCIIKGLSDPKLAELIAEALNEAYHQGENDEKQRYQEKIKHIFDIQ